MNSNYLAQTLDLPKRTVALVLAGGRGSRLHNLTDSRAKPAVYFGGKFRIIDFALSNCLNSGIRRIGVITQYKSHSLLRHLQRGWAFMKTEMNEFVDLLPAQQRVDEESWYRGTADAVSQNQDILDGYDADYVVVLAGDHVYKMNYALMLADHAAQGRPCTVGCIEVPRSEASAFGVMAVDEQPAASSISSRSRPTRRPCPASPTRRWPAWASTSSTPSSCTRSSSATWPTRTPATTSARTSFRTRCARATRWRTPSAMSCVGTKPGQEPYWRDVGTIDAYWDANIDLTATDPLLNMYDTQWPILTYQPQLPPAKFVHNQDDRRGMAIESLVSGGCIISGRVFRSVLFSSVRVHSYSTVNWSVLLPLVQVGRGVRLNRVVVDRGCELPDGIVIGEDPAEDARRFYRTANGITLVTPAMLAALR